MENKKIEFILNGPYNLSQHGRVYWYKTITCDEQQQIKSYIGELEEQVESLEITNSQQADAIRDSYFNNKPCMPVALYEHKDISLTLSEIEFMQHMLKPHRSPLETELNNKLYKQALSIIKECASVGRQKKAPLKW